MKQSHRFVKRSVSTSSDEADPPDLRDPEKPAGVRDWDFSEQAPSASNSDVEAPLGWLSQCYVITYNSLDYMLLLNQQRFALLTRLVSVALFILKACGHDNITCGCLFGLGTHRVSEALDCLIVAVGMSNGHVVFFTERGVLLFDEQFSESEIYYVTFDQTEESQQLTVVTSVDFFAVDPISLHSTLLKAKSAESISSAALPPYYTYMYTSDKVFSTFAWTSDADKKKIWQEAIKYGKSFVPHFGLRDMLGFSTSPRKKTAVSQPSRVITTRGTLDDSRLAVETAVEVSRGLVAIVDHIARIVNRQIIRIWKGYREATVAWINSSNNEQTALFLAIFAPRRALLEVWNV
ncbi:hypothetical protein OSTOST_18353, partial [Ostertagia ostertagi]